MKKILFFSSLLVIPCLSQGQDSTRIVEGKVMPIASQNVNRSDSARAVNYLEKSVWRIEFFGPGLINESRIGRQTTFVSHLRTVGSFVFRSSPTKTENYSAYTINPQVSVAVRQFYNFARRLENGKSIRYNSGNYVTAKLAYIAGPIIEHNLSRTPVRDIRGATVQAMWGLQRTYPKNFYINLEAGLGFGSFYASPVALATYFTLGYTFPNQR